jgi:hypothetical protein
MFHDDTSWKKARQIPICCVFKVIGWSVEISAKKIKAQEDPSQ